MAQSIGRLRKLRALQAFHQYLRKIETPQADVDALDAWIIQKEQKLRDTDAYLQIEQAVWKLPTTTTHLKHSLKNRFEVLSHVHEKHLACSSRQSQRNRVANGPMPCASR